MGSTFNVPGTYLKDYSYSASLQARSHRISCTITRSTLTEPLLIKQFSISFIRLSYNFSQLGTFPAC